MKQKTESPEVTNDWTCPHCDNKTSFIGVDFDAWGGPEVCHCGAASENRPRVRGTYGGAECTCTTTLVQRVDILRDELGNFVEVDQHCYVGGGTNSEIGDYDKIVCDECGTIVWTSYPAGYGMQAYVEPAAGETDVTPALQAAVNAEFMGRVEKYLTETPGAFTENTVQNHCTECGEYENECICRELDEEPGTPGGQSGEDALAHIQSEAQSVRR